MELQCRACEGTNNLEFLSKRKNKNILEMLKSIGGMAMKQDVYFPQCICSGCIQKLQHLVALREQYQTTISKYQCLLSVRETEPLPATTLKNEKENSQKGVRYSLRTNKHRETSEKVTVKDVIKSTKKTNDKPTGKRHYHKRDKEYEIMNMTEVERKLIQMFEENLSNLQRLFKCNRCQRFYSNEDSLANHGAEEICMSRFKCKRCGRIYEAEKDLIKHEMVPCQPGSYQCTNCSEVFNNYRMLCAHNERHLFAMNPECEKCGRKFTKLRRWKNHFSFHAAGNTADCEICVKWFSTNAQKREHKLWHEKPELFKCEICDKQFYRLANLETHRAVHEQLLHKCNFCGKPFPSDSTLQDHLLWHENPECFKCEECNILFLNKQKLNEHQKAHSNTSLKCTYCGKVFQLLWKFKAHQIQHEQPEMFACETCGKTYTKLAKIKDHRRWHDNPDLFKCQFCTKTFESSKLLRLHNSRVHSESKIYKCDQCDKEFKQKYTYTAHVILHANPDRFKCNVCGRACANSKSLAKHLKKVHKNRGEANSEAENSETENSNSHTADQSATHDPMNFCEIFMNS